LNDHELAHRIRRGLSQEFADGSDVTSTWVLNSQPKEKVKRHHLAKEEMGGRDPIPMREWAARRHPAGSASPIA
jgi:hypothetical protein